MARDTLQYDKMVEGALRGVVRDSLTYAAKQGLPGNHHFYLTFRTHFPGVEISDHLRAQYPSDMTIVLQHQFWGLEAHDDHFVVNLSFSSVAERLRIPYAALLSFVDPSVKFGLQFQPAEGAEAKPATIAKPAAPLASKPEPSKPLVPVAEAKPAETKKAEDPAEAVKSSRKSAPLAPAVAKPAETPVKGEPAKDGEAAAPEPGKIVSLDAFRKK